MALVLNKYVSLNKVFHTTNNTKKGNSKRSNRIILNTQSEFLYSY
jgi:hypothetical protein